MGRSVSHVYDSITKPEPCIIIQFVLSLLKEASENDEPKNKKTKMKTEPEDKKTPQPKEEGEKKKDEEKSKKKDEAERKKQEKLQKLAEKKYE